jgi:hypothetical protein
MAILFGVMIMYIVEMVQKSTGQSEYILGVYTDNEHAQFASWVEEAVAPVSLVPRVSYFEADYIDPVKQDAFEDYIED